MAPAGLELVQSGSRSPVFAVTERAAVRVTGPGGFGGAELPVAEPVMHPVEAVRIVQLGGEYRGDAEGQQIGAALVGQGPQVTARCRGGELGLGGAVGLQDEFGNAECADEHGGQRRRSSGRGARGRGDGWFRRPERDRLPIGGLDQADSALPWWECRRRNRFGGRHRDGTVRGTRRHRAGGQRDRAEKKNRGTQCTSESRVSTDAHTTNPHEHSAAHSPRPDAQCDRGYRRVSSLWSKRVVSSTEGAAANEVESSSTDFLRDFLRAFCSSAAACAGSSSAARRSSSSRRR